MLRRLAPIESAHHPPCEMAPDSMAWHPQFTLGSGGRFTVGQEACGPGTNPKVGRKPVRGLRAEQNDVHPRNHGNTRAAALPSDSVSEPGTRGRATSGKLRSIPSWASRMRQSNLASEGACLEFLNISQAVLYNRAD